MSRPCGHDESGVTMKVQGDRLVRCCATCGADAGAVETAPAPGAAVEHCPICHCPPSGQMIPGTDPAGKQVGLHKLCALELQVAQAQGAANIWSQLCAALVYRAGSDVEVTQEEIRLAAEAGPVNANGQPGANVRVKIGDGKRIIIAGAIPRGLPKLPT